MFCQSMLPAHPTAPPAIRTHAQVIQIQLFHRQPRKLLCPVPYSKAALLRFSLPMIDRTYGRPPDEERAEDQYASRHHMQWYDVHGGAVSLRRPCSSSCPVLSGMARVAQRAPNSHSSMHQYSWKTTICICTVMQSIQATDADKHSRLSASVVNLEYSRNTSAVEFLQSVKYGNAVLHWQAARTELRLDQSVSRCFVRSGCGSSTTRARRGASVDSGTDHPHK